MSTTDKSEPRAEATPASVLTAEVCSNSLLSVSSYTNWSEAQDLRRAWEELLAQSPARTIFLTWEWVQAWWSTFGSRRGLLLLTCMDAEGTVVAIVPLQRTWEETGPWIWGWLLRLVGDGIGGSENLDWLVREGYEAAAVHAVCDWLDQHRALWDAIGLNTVPAASPVIADVRAEFRRRGWRQVERRGNGYIRRLPESWEGLLASLSKNKRTQVNTRWRKLHSRFSVRARRCEKTEELPEFLEHLIRLHQKRWQTRGKAGSFALEQKRIFYREMAQMLLSKGWLDFWLLELDGKAVAAEFGFHYEGTYSFLQGGFDPEFASYSVGVVLRAYIMQDLIGQGTREYDFLGGDDQYKHSWSAESRSYVFLLCARPFTRVAAGLVVDITVEKTKDWLRAHTAKPIWQTLKVAYRHVKPAGSAK